MNQIGGHSEDHFWDIKVPTFGNLKDKMGQQDKPPVQEGYPYCPLPPSSIIKSTFALLAISELNILIHFLTNLLPVSLPLEER